MTDSTVQTPESPSRIVLDDVPVTLFGHPSTSARLELQARSRGWRIRKAAAPLVAGLVVAPVVALLPPHAPWALVALATGGILARRKWKERFTILDAEARCPRCDTELPLPEGTRLRSPHPLTCPECGHEPVVEVPEEL
ncbi:MAG: hypothetical protein R3223_05415 [Longimicrobiales bacterium]|nr:hypothetical protein [Longimicrobiales bacterium]